MKQLINKLLGLLGFALVRQSSLHALISAAPRARDLEFLAAMPRAQVGELLALLPDSQSQLRQDLFVLSELGCKRDGYFVEFGAADGRNLSNSWLLEKRFGWQGVLAEPAKKFHAAIRAERACVLETRCVWKCSGEKLSFDEVAEGELSTLSSFSDGDMHRKARKDRRTYEVETISLLDLLDAHGAPATPDYLSIDTEGSEWEILRTFDFKRYPFRVITCEHNFTSQREQIHDLLRAAGYVRKYENLSQFDDWYVRG